MSDLLKNINSMLDEVMASENNTMKIYTRLSKVYEGLENEKFSDVAGLYKPNLFAFILNVKTHVDELNNIKFHIETRISDKDKKDSENMMSKWEESIGKIPQKDEFTLEGIETWHISHYEMVVNYEDIHNPLLKEEARKLVASGFNLAFNHSHGTGSILTADGGFIIELWQNMKKTIICRSTLDDVIDWIISFYEAE